MGKNPYPAIIWLAIIATIAAMFWGGGSWYLNKQQGIIATSPFLQVTNRQFSLFLWQFPEYMRANVSSKNGYLPGFQYQNKIAIEPGLAEEYVVAPPEVIFFYHTWSRLISDEFPQRPIDPRDFREFLEYCQEWKPANWPGAPKEYQELVGKLAGMSQTLPLASVPLDVQHAYIGWKNYFGEGELINLLKPNYGDMDEFLKRYPHYTRNYWRNIVMKGKPDYLKTITTGHFDAKAPIPENEIAAFLKVAYFNFIQSKKNL